VGEAANLRHARTIVHRYRPSQLIVEMHLPDGDAISVVQDLRKVSPETRVLVLSRREEQSFVQWALCSGIAGYAFKSQPSHAIVEAARQVAEGGTYVPPECGGPRAILPQDPLSSSLLGPLSARERVVFGLVVRGYSNQEIAQALLISVKTVETHRAHINRRLGVHSTGALIRLAALSGLLGAPITFRSLRRTSTDVERTSIPESDREPDIVMAASHVSGK
jgi:two-component system response regulator NreC